MSQAELLTFDTPRGPVTLSHTTVLAASGHDPLVLVHGLCSNSRVFKPLIPVLAAQRRSILSFDWPGFGLSPLATRSGASPPAKGVAEFVDVLRGFILESNLSEDRTCVLVGHAEGAFIAISFACAYPDMVSSLILLSPVLPPSTPAATNVLHMYQTLAIERTPRDLAAGLARLTTGNESAETRYAVERVLLGEIGEEVTLENTDGFRRMCKAMETAKEPNYSRILAIRSLIVGGLTDAHASPAVLHSLAASLHGTVLSHAKDDLKVLLHYGWEREKERRWERETRIVTVDAGHWLPLEQPERVALIIEDFLEG